MPTTAQSDLTLSTVDPLELLIGRERIGNPYQIFQLIESGIPVGNAVQALTELNLIANQRVLTKVISISVRALLRNAQQSQSVLNPNDSWRLLILIQTMRKAVQVFGSLHSAERWILKPAFGLNGLAPLDLIVNPVGYEIVTDFLTRLEYGVYQ
ncbi:putative toxin-antitoxin system antitoxin component [compost metagenome]